jgi:hypothetical protein
MSTFGNAWRSTNCHLDHFRFARTRRTSPVRFGAFGGNDSDCLDRSSSGKHRRDDQSRLSPTAIAQMSGKDQGIQFRSMSDFPFVDSTSSHSSQQGSFHCHLTEAISQKQVRSMSHVPLVHPTQSFANDLSLGIGQMPSALRTPSHCCLTHVTSSPFS